MRSISRVASWALTATCVLSLCGCTFLDSFVPKKGDSSDVIDRQQNLSVDDFRNLNKIDKMPDKDGQPTITATLGAPPIPDVAQVLAAPRPPKVANEKLVTLAVTDDVPLRDVLFELGRLANVDIEVGSGLDTTGINLRATNRPFNEVIERIATLGHLRYTVNGTSLRVEKDLPYIKNYSLDFLNLVRSTTSQYQIQTSILGGGSSSSGGSSGSSSSSSSSSGSSSGVSATSVGTSGTQSSITSTGDSDMWSAFEASVNEILAYDPNGPADANGSNATAATKATAVGAAGKTGGAVINRQSGILSVNATQAQHEMIAHFLELMQRNGSAQVLIEAKIVEVQLTDQFVAGVNWNKILSGVNTDYFKLGNYIPDGIPSSDAISTNGPSIAGVGSIAFGIKSNSLDAVLKAAQEYGTTRTLSSPRLSATNNQQAVLTFARNEVFFNCTNTPATTIASTTSTTVNGTTNCTPNAVPIGIILNILPAINLDTQEVMLNVRPTLTRVVGTTPDPTPGITNSYPVIEVRELDSVMKVASGGIMVIGGLMEDSTRNTTGQVPGLGEVPVFGNLFKSRSEDSSKRELIIFIKATIVNPDGTTERVDRKVYNKYVTDPRPLFGPQK